MASVSSPPLSIFRVPPLAIQNVLRSRGRSLVAIAGIGFASIMVLLQLGFLEAVKTTAATNYLQLDFDIALVSTEFEQFYDPGSFPIERLRQAESQGNVLKCRPLYARMNQWRCPPYPVSEAAAVTTPPQVSALKRWWLGNRRPRPLQVRDLLLLGVDLDRNPFLPPVRNQVEAARASLQQQDSVLMNEWSNPDFGWNERGVFSGWELGGRTVRVMGGFRLQRSFGADAAILCDVANFSRAFHSPLAPPVNFGLLSVQPGKVDETVEHLNQILPPDVKALSRTDLLRVEQDYWVTQTATGKIFSFGVLVTMIVATVVVYQVLSNDVRDHLPEYATLKAMGHTNLYLSRVVLVQAAIYAFAAYVPAVLLGYPLYRITDTLANIPMTLTSANLALVLVLNLVAAVGSGFLTLNKIRSADPADLF